MSKYPEWTSGPCIEVHHPYGIRIIHYRRETPTIDVVLAASDIYDKEGGKIRVRVLSDAVLDGVMTCVCQFSPIVETRKGEVVISSKP